MRVSLIIGLILLCVFSAVSISAQVDWVQIGSDIEGEGGSDAFGYSIALSGDGSIMAIGAIYNDGNGADSGHVRVFENQSGIWLQIGSDIDGEATDDFNGCSVSLSDDGSILAVGAIQNDGNGIDSGHVRVYENQMGNWVQIGQSINGEAAGDRFGWSVSLSSDGNVLAVGATQNDGNGVDSGHVRVFENLSGNWIQIGADIDGPHFDANFGFSVSISDNGNILAIGSPNYGLPFFNDSGLVRVFENQFGNWIQVGDDIEGDAQGDESGFSVSLSSDGSVVAIGAPKNSDAGVFAGQVRIFENSAGTWTQIGSDIDGDVGTEQSGCAIALSADGSMLVVGARFANNGSTEGRVRIYENQLSSWVQLGSDLYGDEYFDEFGISVAISNDSYSTLAIGAYQLQFSDGRTGYARGYSLQGVTPTPTPVIEAPATSSIGIFIILAIMGILLTVKSVKK